MRILLVEDEKKISKFIQQGLQEESYIVDIAFDGLEGESMICQTQYNLVILDVMLPKLNGFLLCQKLREHQFEVPILMLSAKGDLADKITGLNNGADDYLTKPFEFDELLARVRALLRRQKSSHNILSVNTLTLNLASHEVYREDKKISLTLQEYRLLEYLMLNQGIVVSRHTLAEFVWQDPDTSYSTIDVYINYLRKKVDKPFESQLIKTIRGIGYMMQSQTQAIQS